jgi:hypothetical protein
VSFHPLDVVVLNTDLPAQGLKRGDLGAVVDVYGPDAIEVEFVTASGRTKALITLKSSDIREVGDDDLVAVRPTGASPNRLNGRVDR